MERYISIDIETLGLNPDKCDLIEFAAVMDDLKSPVNELPVFHRYVVPPPGGTYRGEPMAMAMHSEILKRIAKREPGYEYTEAAFLTYVFTNWLLGCQFKEERVAGCDSIKIVVAGKNYAWFDARFLRRCFDWENSVLVDRHILDPAMLYFDYKTDKAPPNLSECLRRAGIEKVVAHDAVNDALDVIRCLRSKWDLPV